MSKILLITTVLLCAAATTACTSQIRQSVHADQEIEKDVAISHGESKTRAEVNADLVLWKRAGLDKLWRGHGSPDRSEEHTSELQSLMRISYDVICWKKKT